MKPTSRCTAWVVFAVLSVAPCFAHHMAVIVSKHNRVTTLTSAQLGKIVREETKKWPDGTSVQLVMHRASEGETGTLARLNNMTTEQWQAWVAEHKDSITLVDTDADIVSYVENTPGAIGLIEVHSLNDRVIVLHIDGKVPLEGGYLPH